MQHVFLIGYRGCGKSTVGRTLARLLECSFVDTDDEIERISERSIQQIFADRGESGFRQLEEQVVADCASRSGDWVVALGGGAILRPANREQIRKCGRCVWLKGSADTLHERIGKDIQSSTRRPNLSARGGYDEVVELLSLREPLYAELADLTVDTDDRQPDEIAVEIADWAKENS